MEILNKLSGMGGASGVNEDGSTKVYKNFRNIPR
jgi:hypothetical protein